MSSFPSSSAISAACRTLKFSAPPSSKKILKQRFLELAKDTHPDRAKAKGVNVNHATKKMAQLTESYKTLQTVVAAGGRGGMVNNGTFIKKNNNSNNNDVGSRGAQDAASAGFGMGENISNPTEREESKEDFERRRKDMMERVWLPWQKSRREDCQKARPIDEDTLHYRYLYGHRVPVLSMRILLSRFWKTCVPLRQKQFLINAGNVVQQKTTKVAKSLKFVVTGRT